MIEVRRLRVIGSLFGRIFGLDSNVIGLGIGLFNADRVGRFFSRAIRPYHFFWNDNG